MRFLVVFLVVASAANLLAAAAAAQNSPPGAPGQPTPMYQPADYAALLNRIEQLEANQAYQESNQAVTATPIYYQGGFYAQYDNVIVKPYLSENSAFNAQIADDNTTNIPFDLSLTYAPRIEVGYLAPTAELGFRARYWHFKANAAVGPANNANGLIADDAISVAVGATVQDVDSITAVTFGLNMDVLDLEATRSFGNGTFAAGIRTAWIGQSYNLGTDEGALMTNLDVSAIGPTLAYEWRTGQRREGLSWLASIRGSMLYGSKNVFSDGPDNNYLYDSDTLIFNTDAQLGAEYSFANGFFLRAALEAQYWSNTGNATNHNTGAGDDTGDDEFVGSILHDDLGFLGMVFSAGYQW